MITNQEKKILIKVLKTRIKNIEGDKNLKYSGFESKDEMKKYDKDATFMKLFEKVIKGEKKQHLMKKIKNRNQQQQAEQIKKNLSETDKSILQSLKKSKVNSDKKQEKIPTDLLKLFAQRNKAREKKKAEEFKEKTSFDQELDKKVNKRFKRLEKKIKDTKKTKKVDDKKKK